MVTIRLLGPPAIERADGPARPPRGRKAWALLAYLLLAERPPGRRHLADLLFGDADDPLGALRWTLAELRRALGTPGALTGDPVTPRLGGDVAVDVHQVTDDGGDPRALLALDGELLDGVSLPNCLEFESWLLVARHRVAAAAEARLRQVAVGLLAAGRAADAVPYAARVVAGNPLEEGNHELLVRALAAAGDRTAALRQVAVCADLLRRELDVDVSPALREAATVGPDTVSVAPLSGRAAAVSQLEAGRAAIAAGAVDAGVQCLRRAVAESARYGDDALRARALVALGGALAHGVRGRDEEAALVLREAVDLADRAGDRAAAVTAHRQLGWIDVQAGRRETAARWLARAQELAEGDAELSGILGVRGQSASDQGDYPTAFGYLTESVGRAGACGDHRQQAWSLAILARAHVLRGERHQAADAVSRALALVHEQRWMAFLPFPQTLRAELDLAAGDLEAAGDGLEQAWVLARQLDDPCWEGMAARGLGLLHAGRGDRAAADGWLGEATVRCNRTPDRYQWIHGYVLDAAAGEAVAREDAAKARGLAAALGALAARCDMRELVVRSHLHRHRLGDGSALAAARMLGRGIDNPELGRMLA